jgi:uncharacterized protein YyaL (SSP411 family)
MTLEFLLQTHHRTKRQEPLEIVSFTCRKMAEGGIYDQLGGGFHRYSTDARWLVPHFEKMLYDNALLSRLYLHHYQLTADQLSRNTAEGILDYVVREMTDQQGGFYSTQDADSEGHEGKFFVWGYDEILEVLGKEDARLFAAYYNVTKEGNFEGKNILNVTRSWEEVASQHNVSPEQLSQVLSKARWKLFQVREERIKPDRDEKILTAWNGLMLSSFAEAGAILGRRDYRDVARKNGSFVLSNLRKGDLLLRTFKDGQAKLNAYLEDYAFLADGLLTIYQTTGEIEWLKEALAITDTMIDEFWDDENGGFFFTGKSHESLIVRNKDFFDNATPSGNSVAADVLLRLALLTDNDDYRRRAVSILRLLVEPARRYSSAFGRALCAFDFYLGQRKEIAIVGDADSGARDLVDQVWQRYLPNKVVAMAAEGDTKAQEVVPLLKDRSMVDGAPTAYVCENYTCQRPVTTVEELAAQL